MTEPRACQKGGHGPGKVNQGIAVIKRFAM